MTFPEAGFLSQNEQEKYDEAVKSSFNSEKARQTLCVPLKCSNLFKVIFLNQIGMTTATLPELDRIAELDSAFLQGTYEDAPSVILRSKDDTHANNNNLAKSLARLVKKRTFNEPIIINGLEIAGDENSFYGLGFKKGEKFSVIKAPDFKNKNNNRRFKRINPDYSIDFDDDSKRTLYTGDNGLSRLCLGGVLYLYSNYDDLAYSFGDGRVVLISTGEAGSQKIQEYLKNLQSEKDKQISEINKRYVQAEKIIKGIK